MKWWQFRKRNADLERELQSDLDLEEEEQCERGLPPEEAHYAARRAFGNSTLIREQTHEAWSWGTFERITQDIRDAFRQMGRSPAFTITATLTLALGIAASTSIFSVADALLLRPLPYPQPQNIVRIWEQAPDGHRMNLAQKNFDDFQAQNHTFDCMAEYGSATLAIVGGSEVVRSTITAVSKDFFRVLGIQPFLGRSFTPEEQRPHGTPAILVSYSYWKQFLGGTTNLTGLHLSVAGTNESVVGVMPDGFDYPSGTSVWIPSELNPDTSDRTAHNWHGIGRIHSDITVAKARADLGTIAYRLKARYGKGVDLDSAAVMPLANVLVGDVRSALLVIFAAVGMLLLVACTNVAGLLIARTTARTRELAVRAALGAGRGRLVCQFLAESFALSITAGAAGIMLAALAIKTFPSILPADFPRREGIAMNVPVLLFALAVTAGIALSLGLFMAWRTTRADLRGALNAGAQQHSASSSVQRLRSVLVTGEIAMTLVVLIAAGLLARSFLRLIETSPGFHSDHLITMQFSLPPGMEAPVNDSGVVNPGTIERQVSLVHALEDRLRALPGARSVGLVGALPVAAGDNLADGEFLILDGIRPPTNFADWGVIARNPNHIGVALYCVASREYFTTLGVPLISGRLFDARDNLATPDAALVSQSLARRRWPNQNPIGKIIDFGNMDGNQKPLTIVGIVGDVRVRGLDLPPGDVIYVNYRQRGMNINATPTILLRTDASKAEVIPAARRIFHDVAPDAPVTFSTFDEEMGGWLAERRFLLFLIGGFAAAALALVGVGLYGVIAFFVSCRTQEIGIRMAVGAQRGSILRLVVGEGLRLAAFGVAIGVITSLFLTRLLASLLFGVSPTDPVTFTGIAAILLLVTLAACYVPARRAMTVDPVTALRYE